MSENITIDEKVSGIRFDNVTRYLQVVFLAQLR